MIVPDWFINTVVVVSVSAHIIWGIRTSIVSRSVGGFFSGVVRVSVYGSISTGIGFVLSLFSTAVAFMFGYDVLEMSFEVWATDFVITHLLGWVVVWLLNVQQEAI